METIAYIATIVGAVATVVYVFFTRGIVLANRKMAEENVKMVEVTQQMVKANQATLEEMQREFDRQNISHLAITIPSCDLKNSNPYVRIELHNPSNSSAIDINVRGIPCLRKEKKKGTPPKQNSIHQYTDVQFPILNPKDTTQTFDIWLADDATSLDEYIKSNSLPIVVVEWEDQTGVNHYTRKWQLVKPPEGTPDPNDNWSLKFLPEESNI